MSPKEFVKIVRKGSDKLRVDKIVLDTNDIQYTGKGMLHVSPESLRLEMVVDEGRFPAMKATGVYTKSEKWKISGVIEDLIPFKCDNIVGGDYSFHSDWDIRQMVTIQFDLNPLELISTGTDKYSAAELSEIQAQILQQQNLIPPESAAGAEDAPKTPVVEFFAMLKDYKMDPLLCEGTQVIRKNPYLGERQSGRLDTIKGEVDGFEYAFIREVENDDLAVHFNSLPGYSSASPESDWKMFYSLMMALAMIQGIHAWPYRIAYWREGRKITDKITPARRLAETFHTPFRRCKYNFQAVIKLGFEFFRTDAKLNNEVSNLLFLFREASDYESVHGDITAIAICVLFESLVNAIFTELNLGETVTLKSQNIESFLAAKKEITEYISQQKQLGRDGFSRLAGIVGSAQAFHMRDKLNEVSNHFGLVWEGKMETVFQTWQKIRNPVVHGKARTGETEAESKNNIYSLAKIAGAFNLLVLKLIGYSGGAMASAFDERPEVI